MKNIILNKTESFVRRNTSDHACQIFCSKSNCETMYHRFFSPPRDNRGQKNEQSEYLLRPQLFRCQTTNSPFSRKKFLSLCSIVTNTEWNGIIKLIIEVKCIRIILSPNLIDLVVF